jgi:hypothetical protein
MSKAHSAPQSAPAAHVQGTDDDVSMKKIIAVGVVSLVVFALSAVVAYVILRRDEAELRQRGVAPMATGLARKHEIGMVDYIPFDADARLDRWRAEKAKALNSYGWVDRSKRIIHIPVEEAMKELIRQNTGPRGVR